jgi:hypothetical protein
MKHKSARKRACENGVDDAIQSMVRGASRRPMMLAGFGTPYTANRRDRFRPCEVCGNPSRSIRCGKCAASEEQEAAGHER